MISIQNEFYSLQNFQLRGFCGDGCGIDHGGSDPLAMKGSVAEGGFRCLGAAIVEVEIVLPGEAHATVDLDAAVADGAGGVAGVHFGDGDGGGSVGRILFEGPAGIVDGGTGAFRFEIHVGALVLHSLEHADGFAELFPSFGVFDGDVESALHAADEFRGESGGGDVEGAREIRGCGEFFRGSVAEFDDVEFSS